MKGLIIDDERMARQELRRLLAAHPEVEIVGEASNGEEALEVIGRLAPDILFLDVQLPGMTGFDLLEKLREAPDVIFTTAYDQHALRAFDASAIDYLLKPIAPARLAEALRRVRPRRQPSEQIFLRDGERCWIVKTREIDLLESEGNYTRVYFRGESPLIAGSLGAFEARLPPDIFFRGNRRQILNLSGIEKTALAPAGNLAVTLRSGREVELSRRQSALLREILSI